LATSTHPPIAILRPVRTGRRDDKASQPLLWQAQGTIMLAPRGPDQCVRERRDTSSSHCLSHRALILPSLSSLPCLPVQPYRPCLCLPSPWKGLLASFPFISLVFPLSRFPPLPFSFYPVPPTPFNEQKTITKTTTQQSSPHSNRSSNRQATRIHLWFIARNHNNAMRIDYLSKVGAAVTAFFAPPSFPHRVGGQALVKELYPVKSVAIIGKAAEREREKERRLFIHL